MRAPPLVEARALTKTFELASGPVRALDGVDLAVAPGELVALMGPSGSGKSTLLRLLGGLDRPTSGEVVVDGETVSSMSRNQRAALRRRRVGYVFQELHLLPTLTALAARDAAFGGAYTSGEVALLHVPWPALAALAVALPILVAAVSAAVPPVRSP